MDNGGRAIAQATRAVGERQTINPKNVLGFYATILGILFAGSIGLVGVLAATGQSTYLIPAVLAFTALTAVGVIVAVLVINVRRPANLMLSQVSGTEYVEIYRSTLLGDSVIGERQVAIAPTRAPDHGESLPFPEGHADSG